MPTSWSVWGPTFSHLPGEKVEGFIEAHEGKGIPSWSEEQNLALGGHMTFPDTPKIRALYTTESK